MKSWKLFVALFGVLALGMTSAYAQSSKFAATYDTDVRMIDVSADGDSAVLLDPDNIPGNGDEYWYYATTAGPVAEADLANLHVAQWKEILGNLSAQVNLVTFTQAKGRNGAGTSTAIAEGTVRGGMVVVPEGTFAEDSCRAAFDAYDARAEGWENIFSAPGPVTFASRRQELSVTVDLDVVGDIDGVCDETCIQDSLGIEGSVTIALGLDTTAAHSFQFIEEDLPSGTYDVVACYDLTALAAVSGTSELDAGTAAYSKVALGPRIISAQEVRATKTGIIDETGTD